MSPKFRTLTRCYIESGIIKNIVMVGMEVLLAHEVTEVIC